MLKRLWSYRHLVLALVRMQYQLRFRQSLIGVVWAVVPPLATLGMAVLVFDRVAGIDTGGVPYALFALAGLAPWTFFANSLMFGIPAVVQAPQLVSRLSFPKAVLPISMVGVSLIDLGIAGGILAVIVYATGNGLSVASLWLPALVLTEIVLAAGLVLLASALNVFARDLRVALPIVVQLLLFLTPVMYPLAAVPPGLHAWYRLNPMTGLVESFRGVLIAGTSPSAELWLPAVAGAILAFAIGSWYFSSTERRFADVL
ncbi:MAG: ABC transporter permease [Actinomycetota bacterium]